MRRVAVAGDSSIADLGPRLAERFVTAEVRGFDSAQLDDARLWAGDASDEAVARAGTHAAEPRAGAHR